jgi:hypothetical protein
MKKIILLIPIMFLFSCGEMKTFPLEKDVGNNSCPVCPGCAPPSAKTCSEERVEDCIENCISENSCFFTFSIRTCIRACAHGCLDVLGCNWR